MPRLAILIFSLLSLVILLSSCQKDNMDQFVSSNATNDNPTTNGTKSYNNVDSKLWTYFQRFEEAAAARGLSININQLGVTGDLEDLPGESVGGTCTWNSHAPNEVVIDEPLFNQLPDLYKEFIIFHELGHCILNRGHREDAHANGACISLMRSGLEDCVDNYNDQTRTSYIDELFNPNDF